MSRASLGPSKRAGISPRLAAITVILAFAVGAGLIYLVYRVQLADGRDDRSEALHAQNKPLTSEEAQFDLKEADTAPGDSKPAQEIELLFPEPVEMKQPVRVAEENPLLRPKPNPFTEQPMLSSTTGVGGTALMGQSAGDRAVLLRAYGGAPGRDARADRPARPADLPDRAGEGEGPGQGGDRYREIVDNRFLSVSNNPLSTFSIDVDTASYSKARRLILQARQLPPRDAVRIEEFTNYFHYNYPGPKDDKPFAVHTDVAPCPWNTKHKLLRVAIKGKEIENKDRPNSNLVFLVDVSGSMDEPDKLPLVKRGLATLVERLRENDRVAIVVYAGAAGLVLDSTPGSEKKKILDVLDALQPGGSTAGAQGIHLAYEIAQKNFIKNGTNRVILSTDGDFNVGTTSDAELVRLVEEKAKSGVFLTTLGFGIGNHNDSMLEQIADKGNGHCAYIDSDLEARKVFVEQMSATLVTIAKDVKIQIEFNPAKVAAYRLIGYENRMLRTEDFKDDKKDAGEIGAGHTVTALYELVPTTSAADSASATPEATPLRYQKPSELTAEAKSAELAAVHLRFKEPEGDTSKPLQFGVKETDTPAGAAAADFKFAAAVASFGMLLRNSEHKGDATFDSVLKLAARAADDEHGYRQEFIEMVKAAKTISGK
jgi:Ca-activated chloride channel family protein